MDKNKIKSFAVWARRSLISAVREKAHRIGIYEDKIIEATAVQGGFKLEGKEEIFHLAKNHRDALVSQIKEKGFEQVMEEVAYTWFNRFMGLRYMEVNDYLPSGVRILSSEVEGKKEPDALTKVFSLVDELNLDINKVDKLISDNDENGREKNSIQKQNDIRELFKYILIKQCNELGKIIPQMFEKISDYTELLLPDNLLEEGSVIRKMIEDIEESDWLEEVEIIGWMYQYYISEKKDEVFAALKKNVKITKENIPAATQLFTPKWIVKYMVENSLGRLWLEGHPNEELQKEWKYYLEEAEQEPEVQEELQKIREEHSKLTPEDIKVLDPCMGSGHILVYAFDVLYEIYKTAGYSEREIPRLILQKNLYGLDIDDRAAQLASFALIMKARHYNRRLFREIEREHLELNLCSIQESNSIGREEIDYFCTLGKGKDNEEIRSAIEYLCEVFIDAKEYGSILEVKKINFQVLKERLNELEVEDDLMFADYRNILLEKLPVVIKQAEIISGKYEVCVTNPPYMGSSGMNSKLSTYLKKNYNNEKSDIYAAFIRKGFKYCKKYSFNTAVTMQSWMFLSSMEGLRRYILTEKNIVNLTHMDNNVMGIAFGTSATIFRNSILNYKGRYNFISMNDISKIKEEPISFPIINDRLVEVRQSDFDSISGSPISYWISNKIREIFKNVKPLTSIADSKQGLITGDNEKFLRLWHEVGIDNIFMINNKNKEKCKWFKHNKGGSYRKWYGNNEYLVNWYNNGEEIKQFKDNQGKLKSRPQNVDYYFKEGITWSDISSGKFSIRYSDNSYIFDAAGPKMFMKDFNLLKYVLGFFNTKLANELIDLIIPTYHYSCGVISQIPILYDKNNILNDNIDCNVKCALEISKSDWDSFETSWDFKVNPLLKLVDKDESYKIESTFKIWKSKCEEAFEKLKYNEEELNRIFIDIYGLQDELTPEVEDKDITIRKADRERDIKSFISYAVGCMVGRYSIDAEGLIYAGGEFNDKWNITDKKVRKIEKDEEGNITSDTWVDSRFLPDGDNIIPITEDEYFEDDIVSRFIDFVRTVYGNDTLEENLDFIADSIGRKSSETSRQAIRRYFIKDFYDNHLKIYQKRPIYWMFESGKNDGFKCLIYMHRYNDQTVAKVRTDYLHTLQRKYEAEINRLQLIVDSENHTAKDRNAAKKKIDRISKQIEECREYDKVVAHLANEKISIDLDDGVKVNYAKFQDVKVINSKEKEVKMNLLSKI